MKTIILMFNIRGHLSRHDAECRESEVMTQAEIETLTSDPDKQVKSYELTNFMDLCNDEEFDVENWWVTYVYLKQPPPKALVDVEHRHITDPENNRVYCFDKNTPIRTGVPSHCLGHGGDTFKITFEDGSEVITNNLWDNSGNKDAVRENATVTPI